MTKHLFLLLILSTLITACTNTKPTHFEPTVTIEEPNRMRFSGKGAGAGMMLMSTMGPAGIAIGVAIDEGIGKDIGEAALKNGFNIESIVKQAFTNTLVQSVHVQRYGFVTFSGEGEDPVAPQLHLKLLLNNGNEQVLQYPEGVEKASVVTGQLDEVKANGGIALLTNAADDIASTLGN